MTIGLVGRKAGMTRVFTDAGDAQPVTVIEVLPNRIVQVKDSKSDGYRAIPPEALERSAGEVQLGIGEFSHRIARAVRGDLHGHAVCCHCSHPRLSRLLRNQRSP